MDMISSTEVIRRIESYFEGGAARYLSRAQAKGAAKAVAATANHTMALRPLNFHTAAEIAARVIENIPSYPGGFAGRGIVICGGGVRLFANAWVCIQMLRRLGCSLPIQLWHWGQRELDERMRALMTPLGVECVDVEKVRRRYPARLTHPWALKPYAILYCRFKEVLLLDADNVPVANPEFLFDAPQFRRAGAVFWPDFWRLGRERTAWKLFGVPYRDEPEFETGQVLVNKAVCWRALNLCLWYNQESELFYQHVYGDKETFHMAFRKLNAPFARPSRPIHRLPGVMCQHDFKGRRLFQHRNEAKWDLLSPNRRIRGFWFENECRQFLKQLGQAWDAQIEKLRPPPPEPATRGRGEMPADGEVKLFACMVSSRQRDDARQRTLADLASTDWGQRPVHVQMDEQRFSRNEDNQTHTAWRGLQVGLQSDADYILYLEDDLEFNRCFFGNLRAWPLLRQRQIALASLFNPGLRELARIRPSRGLVIDPHRFLGSKALLVSRDAARFFLRHWLEGPATLDLKLGALSARLDRPVFCHCPSLVRHVGRRSMVGRPFRQARDFQRDWTAPEINPAGVAGVAPATEGSR